MSVERLIAAHLRLANEDLAAAVLLLEHNNRNAAYQAEQALEHVVLALAQAEGVHYGRSQQHQLHTMAKSLPEENALRDQALVLSWLEAYATTYRYPKTKGGLAAEPPKAKLEGAVTKLGELIAVVVEHFGVDLESDDSPARTTSPPRGAINLGL